jgi:soluble cytochrome b562
LISGGVSPGIRRTIHGFAEDSIKVLEVKMSTNELLGRIDESIEMGKRILEAHDNKKTDSTEAHVGMKDFCQGIKVLIEDLYGDGNHLSHKFAVIDGFDPEKVAEGLAVLTDLRRLIIYTGEFSS